MRTQLTVRDFLLRGIAALGMGAGASFAQDDHHNDQHVSRLEVNGGVIEIRFDPDGFDFSTKYLVDWVRNAALAVEAYYGVFPIRSFRVHIESSDERTGVFHGTTWGYNPPLTRIFVGRRTTQQQLQNDWMMTHEMVHTAFPDVARDHHWIEEGIATYVEPVARVQAGQLGAEQIWTDMVDGMPNGEPRDGDAGLDHTHTWGRTYWGGALFCLVADVRIRIASKNAFGLQHALRAIQRAGGTIQSEWSVVDAFEVGDKAVAGSVLKDLYQETKDKPAMVDLPSLWRKLGVEARPASHVAFNDKAAWAATRIAITTPMKA